MIGLDLPPTLVESTPTVDDPRQLPKSCSAGGQPRHLSRQPSAGLFGVKSSAGASTTPRRNKAASWRSRFNSGESAERRGLTGVVRASSGSVPTPGAQSSSLPADTGIASARLGRHHELTAHSFATRSRRGWIRDGGSKIVASLAITSGM